MNTENIKNYLNRNLVYFQENYLTNFLWLYSESTLLFFAIGLGVGPLVPSVGNISYLKYIFVGFIFANLLRIAFLEIGIGFYEKKINRSNSIMRILPFSFEDVLRGELIWSTVKGFMGSLVLISLGFFMEIYEIEKIIILLILVLIGSYLFSSMSLAICLISKNIKSLNAWQFLFVMPMYFLSGVFFPLETLPRFLYYLAMTFPLTHMILVSRKILEGTLNSSLIFSTVILLMYSFLFSFLISNQLSKSSLRAIKA